MKHLFPVLAFLCFASLSAAINVQISVGETIGGRPGFTNSSVHAGYQEFMVVWENIGSVPCITRARMDLYNSSGIAYSSWSGQESMPSGKEAEFRLYSALPPGSYEARLRMYYCNEIMDAGISNISVPAYGKETNPIEIISLQAEDGELAIILRSSEEIKEVAVVPSRYPLGWIAEGTKASLPANRTVEVRVGYVPSRRVTTQLTFSAAAENGPPSARTFSVAFGPKKTDGRLYLFFAALGALASLILLRRSGKL